ncbi:hypothetical protein [Microbulbifer litoralis]|uniref:hypothetical protein n=1 Tax=Microbulbifer litoralis TaxID=2933965 RepID=UPI0020290A50|nr:hypothetical protein [Microbulbifer sp. GX H0434]
MFGAIAVIAWLIFFAIRASNGNQGGTKKSTTWPRITGFFIWVTAIVALLASIPADAPVRVAVLVAALLLLFPSVWIRLPIRAGWVAPSYYLSFLILRVNGHALRAGAAFNAYRALLHKRGAPEAFREQTVGRLRDRIMRHKGKISSGDMLLSILLDTEKGSPGAMRRLERMDLLRKEQVPLPMIRFAFARLMADALADGDWQRVATLSNRWRRKWRLPLASLIECCYHRHMQTRRVNPLDFFLLRLQCGWPGWLSQLPLARAEQASAPDDGDPAALKLKLVQRALSGKPLEQDSAAAGQLLPPQQLDAWSARAQALHCREPAAAVAAIEQSLAVLCGGDAGPADSGRADNEPLTRLRYHAQSIQRRQAGGDLQAGSMEFREWLHFTAVYEQLADDDNDRYEAYSLVEGVVWNWMADLWNIKKERHLAFVMCGYMNPHAREFGSEASKVYEQVLRGDLG